MRVRFLGSRRQGAAPGAGLDLYARRPTSVDAGVPTPIELDLAVALEHGELAVLTAAPDILALGLRPLLGAQLILSADPVGGLRLWVAADRQVEIDADTVLARIAFLAGPEQRFYNDPNLDDVLDPESGRPYLWDDEPILGRRPPTG